MDRRPEDSLRRARRIRDDVRTELMRAASAALLPLSEALTLLRPLAAQVLPLAVPLAEAGGFVAATSVVAPHPIPAAPTALRDGFAVEAALVGGASPYAPVMLSRPPAWVEAGDRLAPACDAVLPPEGFEGRSAVAEAGAGENVRGAGGELAEGDLILAAGERVEPRHILGLAAIGLSAVEIRLPRLRLVATNMPDVLSPMLAAVIARAGGLTQTVTAPDDPDAIAGAILAEGADAILVLGGTGFGRTDRSAEGLARAGRVLAHGLALRPGESAGLGEAAGRPVLLVPGRPDAAVATFLALGRPLMAALAGASPQPPRRVSLRRKIASGIGVSETVFVRRHGGEAEPLGSAELPLQRLIEADGAVLVPPEREGYPEGSEVEVVSL